MKRDDVVAAIQEHKDEIYAFGARRVALFGSVARDEATDASDIDMLVEFEHETPEFRQHMGLLLFLEELLGRTVDLATPRMIRPELEPYIMADLLYVA